MTNRRILLVFIDGVGLAPGGPNNPLATVALPELNRLLGGPCTRERVQRRADRVLVPLDACLGVDGLPQSATGQTALFTGVNGAAMMGRHVTAYPGPRLRAIIAEHSLFLQARRRGLAATFANAFSRRYFDLVAARRLRFSVTVWATRAADLPLRELGDLERGEAVSWDIVGDRLARGDGETVAAVTPQTAGRRLARLAVDHHLTVYETFLTDLAAHRRLDGLGVDEALLRIDGLLGGVLAELPAGTTLVVTSDHGNLEEAEHRQHTRNPVPLLAYGPQASAFADLASLTEVTPRIVACLSPAVGF